jgi:hypothetical protein
MLSLPPSDEMLWLREDCAGEEGPTTGESVGSGFRRMGEGAGDWSVWERKAAKL